MYAIQRKLNGETLECDCCQASFSEGFFLYPGNDEERKIAIKQFKYFEDYREALFVCFGCLQEITKSFVIRQVYKI